MTTYEKQYWELRSAVAETQFLLYLLFAFFADYTEHKLGMWLCLGAAGYTLWHAAKYARKAR